MKKLCQAFILTLLLLGAGANLAFAEHVVAEGRGFNPKHALEQALHSAVEQVVGNLIAPEALVKNYELLEAQIYADYYNYVSSYNVLGLETDDRSVYFVTLEAVIDTTPASPLVAKLEDLALISYDLQNPRLAVLIPEYHGYARTHNTTAEEEVTRVLAAAGFTKIITLPDLRYSQEVQALLDGDTSQAGWLGRAYNVDYFLVGEVVNKNEGAGSQGGFCSRAKLSAKLIKAATGELVAAGDFSAAGEDLSRLAAGKIAASSAATLAGQQLAGELESYIKSPSRLIGLTILNLADFADVAEFEQELSRVFGVKNVYVKQYENRVALLQVDYTGDAQNLADSLARSVALSFKIREISAPAVNSLQIELL